MVTYDMIYLQCTVFDVLILSQHGRLKCIFIAVRWIYYQMSYMFCTTSTLVMVLYEAAHCSTSIDVLVVQDNYKLASC